MPPNVLIFMTDHQRGDTVLPEHPAVTPHLDRLPDAFLTSLGYLGAGPA